MLRKVFFVFCFLALVSVPRAHAMLGLDLTIEAGQATRTPSGTLQVGGGGLTPTSLDLKDTLNLGNHDDLLGTIKFKHFIPIIPNVYINYLPMSFNGDKTITSNVNYGGQTFQTTTTLHSELALNSLDVGLFYDIPFVKTATLGVIDPEIGLNIRSLSFSGKLTGTVGGTANTTQAKDSSVYIPMLYVGLGIYPIKLISFNATVKTLSVSGNGITEWNAELGIHPLPLLFVALGYTSQSITLDTDNIKSSISFSGPYAAVGLSF